MSFKRQDLWICIVLFIFFTIITVPGIGWGTPDFWHPDELAKRVDKQLNGKLEIDATYFNHPFLPQNVMLLVGKILYGLGCSRSTFIMTVRLINVLLAGGIAVTAYLMTRLLGGGGLAGLIAAGLVISSSEIALNARIAHDDIPLAFFTSVAVLLLIQSRKAAKSSWLYLSFFIIGLAASSKYNGVILALVPLALIIQDHQSERRKGKIQGIVAVIVGFGLLVLGFGLSSPQVFLHFPFFVRVIGETMRHHAEFNSSPTGMIGIFGQWAVMESLLGWAVFCVCLIAVVYELVGWLWKQPILANLRRGRDLTNILLLSLFALDLPMLVVRNYPARFFVPLIPLLAVLAGLLFKDIFLYAKEKRVPILCSCVIVLSLTVIILSMLRVVSIALLYQNDARIEASDYLAGLPASSTIEYTFYPPSIPNHYFKRKSNYPLFFPKSLVQGVPDTETVLGINSGEAGLEKRKPDFLIVDSFTSDRFNDPQTCEKIPLECSFFQRLIAGKTIYQLKRTFEYHLPNFLPKLAPFFLNPTIRVYQRMPG